MEIQNRTSELVSFLKENYPDHNCQLSLLAMLLVFIDTSDDVREDHTFDIIEKINELRYGEFQNGCSIPIETFKLLEDLKSILNFVSVKGQILKKQQYLEELKESLK